MEATAVVAIAGRARDPEWMRAPAIDPCAVVRACTGPTSRRMGATSDYTRGGGVAGAARIAASAIVYCGSITSLTSSNASTGASTTAGADANAHTAIVVHGACGAGVCESDLSDRVASGPAGTFSDAAASVAIIPGISGMPAMAAVAPFDALPPVGIGQPGPPDSDVSWRARNPITREIRRRCFTPRK